MLGDTKSHASFSAEVAEKGSNPPPPRPPPPRIFGPEDDPARPLTGLPEAPADEPNINISERPPKLYQLVNVSQETSFWWDSVDATAIEEEDGEAASFEADFASSVSVRVVSEGG